MGIGTIGTAIGAAVDVLPKVKDVAEVFVGNRRAREDNQHEENTSIFGAYSSEWSYQANNRSGWDAFWDGVNRMPRPLCVLIIVGLFPWCAYDPESFERSMRALGVMPEMMWWLIMTILGFYFGAKSYEKSRMPSTKPGVLPAEFKTTVKGVPVATPPGPRKPVQLEHETANDATMRSLRQ